MLEDKFNFLNCFDDSISNLDITKNYIYVLKLVEDRYYVGRTSNILRRIKEHFTEDGAVYTKKYKPLKVIEIEEEKSNDHERIKTLSTMEKYGWEKVRGYCWCSLLIKKPKIKNNNKNKKVVELMPNKNDEKLEFFYCVENKNILEIGKILNISPGSVAYRLEKLNIINRRQLAKGYFEYVESNLYEENKEIRNKKREQQKIKTEEEIDTDKVNLLNIKKLIREKYFS
jgi:predicted GIY-YIG superfamily endonuclease